MMFRLFAVCGILCLGLMQGCSSEEESGSPPAQPTSDAAAETTPGDAAAAEADTAPEAAEEAASDAIAEADATNLSELLIGLWKEPLPSPAVMRFDSDGTSRVALAEEKLDTEPFGVANWKLEGSRLTFTQTAGVCSTVEEEKVGTYELTIDSATVTFAKISDVCAGRNLIDGETWTRLK